MKKYLFTILVAMPLLITSAASAQTIHLRATVPFDFTVRGTSFPAGEYDIQSIGPNERMLAIRSLDSKVGMLVLSGSCAAKSPSSNSKLVFRHTGSSYVLAQLWMLGQQTGYQVAPGSLSGEISAKSAQDVEVLLAQR